jgi:cytochrome c oxidase subunit II
MTDKPHLTTRRGFIAAVGLGGTALYGLWVGYGAAPGPLALFGATHADDPSGIASHDAHAAPQPDTLTPEDFETRVQEFIQRFGEDDGSVRPRLVASGHDTAPDQAHAGHTPQTQADHGDHGGHGAAAHGDHSDATPNADSTAPIDVWLQAGQFFFAPWHLRLATHQPYRFRMMATDVAHGASVQFGRGGRMIRLRPGQLVETEMRFSKAGDYLIYCTVYCGAAHDTMQARLSVTEGGVA